MDEAFVASLQAALDGLQASLPADSSRNAKACRQGVAQLSACVSGVLQQHKDVMKELENRMMAERAMRNVIDSKDAEAARLHGEVARLHASLQQAAAPGSPSGGQHLQDTAAAPDGNQQQQQPSAPWDQPCVEPAQRSAVLDAVVAAKDRHTAVLHQLQSEVSAQAARISALEAELVDAAAAHAASLSGQQQAFLAKLQQLRLVHEQQLETAAAQAQQQHQARCEELEQQLAQASLKQGAQQDLIATLQQQLQQAKQQQQCPDVQQHHMQPAAATPSWSPVMPAAISSPRQQQPAGPKHDPTAEAAVAADAAAATAAAAEVAALRQMEGQLTRLSRAVRSAQAERDQLRATLLAGVGERQALQERVLVLSAQLQAAQGCVAAGP